MNNTGVSQDAFITLVETKLGANYTDEQKEIIKRFGDGPVFCFADPGTGKTYTAIAGLLNAELFKGIPGENIYALSFTRLATGELAVRHQNACDRLRIQRTVNFKTLSALCRAILDKEHKRLGMSKFDTSEALTMETAFRVVEGSANEWNEEVSPAQIRLAIQACRELNNALIFDPDVVSTKMAYKRTKLSLETFDKIRGTLFAYSLLTENISVSDLMLYTVILLQRHPEVSTEFKAKCKLMLVDEAQDLSLLQLRIISLLTDNPVLIGDMKQQIYAFNGACQEVVPEFHKLYPNTVDLKLTQSFRCKNKIADYATQIILPNNIGGKDYKGTGEGGSVQVSSTFSESGYSISELAEKLHEEFVNNQNKFAKEYLFLARNNFSVIPVIEELYKQGLPFRANKYKTAYEIPVMKEICQILNMCYYPNNVEYVHALRYLIPEFRGYNLLDNPFYVILKKTGGSIFEINYQFKDPAFSGRVMNVLADISDQIRQGIPVKDLINALYPFFDAAWLKQNSWRYEAKPKVYLNSVAPLVNKSYDKFIQDEVKKLDIISESERYSRGIRCYTMHASKGLEADVVYILDADEGLIPNTRKLEEMNEKHCDIDIARAIREERALCYVACTRARDELYIVYNSPEPAAMLLGQNNYASYDALYENYKSIGDDIREFERFANKYVPT